MSGLISNYDDLLLLTELNARASNSNQLIRYLLEKSGPVLQFYVTTTFNRMTPQERQRVFEKQSRKRDT